MSTKAVKQTAQEINNKISETDYLILSGVIACFFLSGFAALLYQIAWLRQFSIIFGTSELAVVTVRLVSFVFIRHPSLVVQRWCRESVLQNHDNGQQ